MIEPQTIRALLDEIPNATTSRAGEIVEILDTEFPDYEQRLRWICDTHIETTGSVDLHHAAGTALPIEIRVELDLPDPPRRYKDLTEAALLRLSRLAISTWDAQMIGEISAERAMRAIETTGEAL